MTPHLRYADSAAADLENIWKYHAVHASFRVADEVVERLDATLRRVLALHPESGRKRLEFGSDVRSFPIAPYVVFYRVARRHVQVLRVLHGHRDIQPPLISLLISA
jgi:toxin ParE1/3/4